MSAPVLAAHFAPESFFKRHEKLCPERKRGISNTKEEREAERRTAHPFPIAAPRCAGTAAVICDRTPSGAPLRLCAGIIHPNSAWAALPGITGSKREDPLRRQCSEHLAVRR